MPTSRRKRVLFVLAAVVLLFVALLVVKEWRRRDLDQQLVGAVIRLDSDSVETLLREGANPNANVEGTKTPVLVGALQGLLRRSRPEGHADLANSALWTVMRQMREYGGESSGRLRAADEIGAALIQNGADIQIRNPAGYTALYMAVAKGLRRTVEMLLKKGAPVDARTNHGSTPLQTASENPEIASLLIAHGADVNTANRTGDTPLEHALFGRSHRTIIMLLQCGARVRPEDVFTAIFVGNLDVVRAAVAHGIDLNVIRQDGHSALYHAVYESGHSVDAERMIRFLRAKGARLTTTEQAHMKPPNGRKPSKHM